MKNFVLMFVVTILTATSWANVCNDAKELWDGDQAVGQLECNGEQNFDICVTKFKMKSNGQIYYHITSQDNKGYSPIYTWVNSKSDDSYVSDKNGTLLMQYFPTAAAIIDEHKYRHEIELDKKTLEMWYVKESKRVWSFEFWKRLVDIKLQCKKK